MFQQLFHELLGLAVRAWPVLEPHWPELLGIAFSAIRIFALKRQTRWLRRHSALQEQRAIASSNETLRIVSTAFASGEPLTLDDLLSNAERDWSLRQSAAPSETNPPSRTTPQPRESSYHRITLPPPPPVVPRPPPRKR